MAVSGAMANKLDGSFASSIPWEYLTLKRFLSENRQDFCDTELVCEWALPWPFFDEHKTLRAQHDRWSALVALSTQPVSRNQRALEAYGRQEADLPKFSKLRNPVGAAFNAIMTTSPSVYSLFIDVPQLAKARLSVLRYVLEAAESGDYSNVPIEPMTGEPFIVIDKGDTVEITSAYLKDEEPAIRYEVSKRSR